MKQHWFVHVDSPVAWMAKDPIDWCLANRHRGLLQPARPALDRAVMGDDSHVVSHVLRRCRLNLVTLESGQITVRHWGQDARADLLRLLKATAGVGRKPLPVEFHDDETGRITACMHTDLREGVALPEDWPLPAFVGKFQLRRRDEPGDDSPAPIAGVGLVQPIPSLDPWTWADLKAYWTSHVPLHCPDCDRPAVLASRGCVKIDAFRWRLRHVHVCTFCRTQHVRDPLRAMWVTPIRRPRKTLSSESPGDR